MAVQRFCIADVPAKGFNNQKLLKMNTDLLYKDIANAERLLANISFNATWHLHTRRNYLIRDVQELKGMIDEVERLLNTESRKIGKPLDRNIGNAL